ncbi:MAG: transposase [Pirellulaceae bacterium]|nr:transposase [Pirellulaceae bacterium]
MPHWEVEDGRYFVTAHLAGAIPEPAMEQIRSISEALQNGATRQTPDSCVELHRRVFAEMERWLDRAPAATELTDPAVAPMVMEAIEFRQSKERWNMLEFALMPSHLHLFLEVLKGTLKETMEDFKRWTGHRALEILDRSGERFWQDEWFDHWSRSDEEDERITTYIRRNPETAGLVSNYRDWPWGSW